MLSQWSLFDDSTVLAWFIKRHAHAEGVLACRKGVGVYWESLRRKKNLLSIEVQNIGQKCPKNMHNQNGIEAFLQT